MVNDTTRDPGLTLAESVTMRVTWPREGMPQQRDCGDALSDSERNCDVHLFYSLPAPTLSGRTLRGSTSMECLCKKPGSKCYPVVYNPRAVARSDKVWSERGRELLGTSDTEKSMLRISTRSDTASELCFASATSTSSARPGTTRTPNGHMGLRRPALHGGMSGKLLSRDRGSRFPRPPSCICRCKPVRRHGGAT